MTYKGIPERWECYSTCGNIVPGTNFIAFKVPLKFTIEDLLSNLSENHLKIGLVIDLTNTARYYNPQDFISKGIHYIKLATPGHNVTPSNEVFQDFKNQVKQFEASNHGKQRLIGVHCTHGVNRTGYLICRYMIEELHMKASDAIASFKAARGHPIEKYTDELISLRTKSKRTNDHNTFQPVVAHPVAGRSGIRSYEKLNNDTHLHVKPAIRKKHRDPQHHQKDRDNNGRHAHERRRQFNEFFTNNYGHANYPPTTYYPQNLNYPEHHHKQHADPRSYHHNRSHKPKSYYRS